MSAEADLDARGRRLRAALAAVLVPDNAPEVRLERAWLDSWSGIGLIIVGMQCARGHSRRRSRARWTLDGSRHKPSRPLQGIGFASGRGFCSRQPSGPLNHLERARLTTSTTSTTPMMAPRTRSSGRGLWIPRGSSSRGSIPEPAWMAIVPVTCLLVQLRFSMSLPTQMMAHAQG
jgi:hypothetical protein